MSLEQPSWSDPWTDICCQRHKKSVVTKFRQARILERGSWNWKDLPDASIASHVYAGPLLSLATQVLKDVPHGRCVSSYVRACVRLPRAPRSSTLAAPGHALVLPPQPQMVTHAPTPPLPSKALATNKVLLDGRIIKSPNS